MRCSGSSGVSAFSGLNKPVEFGGAGLDYSYALMMAEEMGAVRSGSVPAAIGVQTDMATPALARYGSDALRREFLAPAISGEAVACVGVSEPGAGSDVAEIRTNARSDGDDYVIDGGKMWITNGAQADWMCLLANTGDGPKHRNKSLICVPMKTKGVTVARKLDKLGLRASDTAQIFFEGVRVPKRNRIGEEGKGFVYQMTQFQEERLWVAAACLKAHERTIAETIAYARQRKAFGRSILDNQTVHFKLAELQTEIELLRSLIYRAAEAMIAGADMTQLATMAKLKAGKLGRELPSACLQYWGGMGFMNETPVSRAFRDSRIDLDRRRRRGGDADDPVQGHGNAAGDGTIAGPMTSRRRGGWLWVGCLQYFAAEAIAVAGFRGAYSFRRNFISDLGTVRCGDGAGCSPLHPLMNASFLVQGVLIFAGAVVVWPLFPRGLARLALGLIAASGLGVAVVGLAPEDAAPGWHYLGAAENLLLSNTGAALIGAALLREKRAPRAVGLLSLGFGLIGLAGLAGLAVRVDFGLGAGVIERIAAYPFPLWLAGMGVWLLAGGGETRR